MGIAFVPSASMGSYDVRNLGGPPSFIVLTTCKTGRKLMIRTTTATMKGILLGGLAACLCGVLVLHPAGAQAGQQVVPVEGVGFSVGASLADNLKLFVGKKVYITLDSGVVMSGVVKEVGDHLVHLERLDGKEYFDALIRVESINAVDARFREVRR